MMSRNETCFYASGNGVTESTKFSTMMRIAIERGLAETAINDMNSFIGTLRKTMADVPMEHATFTSDEPLKRGEIMIEHTGKSDVRITLSITLLLTPSTDDFWHRTKMVARITDFLQRFAQQSHGKGITLDIGKTQVAQDEGVTMVVK
jgi:hypothetical protein